MPQFEQTSQWLICINDCVGKPLILIRQVIKATLCKMCVMSIHTVCLNEAEAKSKLISSFEQCGVCDWDVVRNTESNKRGQIVLLIQYPVKMLTLQPAHLHTPHVTYSTCSD